MPARDSNVVKFIRRPVSRLVTMAANQTPAEAPLRVLIIGDTPDDRVVVRLALEAQGFLISEADSGKRGLATASTMRPDCIVLDDSLPDLDSAEMVNALRRDDGTMPCAIVMLAGSSNRETTTQLLNARELDYLNKKDLGAESLRRAVQGAAERFRLLDDKRRVEERNAHLAAIVVASADAIFSVGLDQIVQTWNPAAVELFGFTEAEAVGCRVDNLIVPAGKRDERAKLFEVVVGDKIAIHIESVRRRKDGNLIPVEINASPMLDENGSVVAVSVVMRDIKERKAAEATLATSAAIFESTHDAVMSFDVDGRFTSWNPAAEALFGYTAREVIGHDASLLVVPLGETPPDETARGGFDIALSGKMFQRDTRRVAKDGTVVEVSVTALPVRTPGGHIVGVSAIMRDITERKRAELAAARLAAIVTSSADAIISKSLDGTVMSWNEGASRVFGYAPEEIIGQSIRRLIPSDRQNEEDDFLSRLRNGERIEHYETVRQHKDGHHIEVSVAISPIRSPAGEVIGASKICRDITERKQAEQALRQRNRQLDLLARTSRKLLQRQQSEPELLECIFQEIIDLLGVEMYAHYQPSAEAGVLHLVHSKGLPVAHRRSSATLRLGDRLCGRVAQMRKRLIIEDLQQSSEPCSEALIASGATSYAGFPFLTHGNLVGTVAFISRSRLHFREGEIQTIQAICDQVATTLERVRLDRELSLSEARYRSVFDNAPTGIAIADEEGQLAEANAAFCNLVGYNENELRRVDYKSLIHPEDLGANLVEIERLMRREVPSFEIENRYRHKHGHDISIRKFVSSIPGSSNEKMRLFALITDMTDRKRVEQTLQATTAQLETLLNNAPLGMAFFDRQHRYVQINEDLAAINGIPVAGHIGRTIADLLPVTAKSVDPVIDRIFETGEVVGDFEVTGETPREPGVMRHWLTGFFPVRDVRGDTAFVGAWVTEITGRKRAETATAEALRLVESILSAAPAAIYIFNVATGCNELCNDRARHMLGYDEQEWRQKIKPAVDLMHPEDASRIVKHFDRLANQTTTEPLDFKYRMRHADGSWRWFLSRDLVYERTPDGQLLKVLGAATDITELKLHEEHTHLLMKEVNHRAKNMLSLIQAIARQTAATKPEDFIERFGQRLKALAASQDLLVKSEWKAVPITELVRLQLAHFGDTATGRISFSGPPLKVTAAAAQTLGLVLHELTTNAAKYGALSNDDGRIDIEWSVHSTGVNKFDFTMRWTEKDGPLVTKPEQRGFGSTVIDRMVRASFGCDVELKFARSGLTWRISCAAGKVLEGDAKVLEGGETAFDQLGEFHTSKSLDRPRVLIVEDEPLIAIEIAFTLTEAGFEVIGPASSVAQALALIEHQDCAIAVLDTNLRKETAEPIAIKLESMRTPFIVMSGYSREQQPQALRHAPLLGKPIQPDMLIAQIWIHLRNA
jgi:PAS domain S-box-containing protein